MSLQNQLPCEFLHQGENKSIFKEWLLFWQGCIAFSTIRTLKLTAQSKNVPMAITLQEFYDFESNYFVRACCFKHLFSVYLQVPSLYFSSFLLTPMSLEVELRLTEFVFETVQSSRFYIVEPTGGQCLTPLSILLSDPPPFFRALKHHPKVAVLANMHTTSPLLVPATGGLNLIVWLNVQRFFDSSPTSKTLCHDLRKRNIGFALEHYRGHVLWTGT